MVERLLVLAAVRRAPDGTVVLVPPPGGFILSGLELDAAMRLLAGKHRRLLLGGYGLFVLAALLLLAAAAVALIGS